MIRYNGGIGTSKDKAIIIHGVYTEWEGVDAEFEFIQRLYSDFELDNQNFIGEKDKKYDLLIIKLPDGTKKEIWFDVTDFCGRE